jgi:hypothetical protein
MFAHKSVSHLSSQHALSCMAKPYISTPHLIHFVKQSRPCLLPTSLPPLNGHLRRLAQAV